MNERADTLCSLDLNLRVEICDREISPLAEYNKEPHRKLYHETNSDISVFSSSDFQCLTDFVLTTIERKAD